MENNYATRQEVDALMAELGNQMIRNIEITQKTMELFHKRLDMLEKQILQILTNQALAALN